jgi:hypothetical protein
MGSSGSKYSAFDGPALVLRRLPLRKWMLRFVNAISSDAHGLMLSVFSVQDKSDSRFGIFSLSCYRSWWGIELDEAEHVISLRTLLALFVPCWTEGREEPRVKSWARARVGVFSFRVHVSAMLPL